MLRTALKTGILAGIYAASVVTARSDFVDALSPVPGVSYKLTKGHRSSTADKVTGNFQHVHALRGDGTNTKSVASILGAHQRQVGGTGYQNITPATTYGTQYALDVTFGGVPLSLLLDTGSSDTWIVQEGFRCVDYADEDVDEATCGFGPAYPGDFQYGAIPDEHMYIQYGDGEIVYGPVGYSDISLGNITVTRQECGLANTTYWYGNNETSGVLGLAYPSLTNAYLGSGMEHNWLDEVSYSPVFTNMVNQGLVLPYFSIAINRNSSGGLIAWGGIPPVKGLDYSTAVSMDIIVVGHLFYMAGLDTDTCRPTSSTTPSRHGNTPSTPSSQMAGNGNRRPTCASFPTLSTQEQRSATSLQVNSPILSHHIHPPQSLTRPRHCRSDQLGLRPAGLLQLDVRRLVHLVLRPRAHTGRHL
jgi:hypothetical protein